MSSATDTVRRLAEMTDAAAFERLVAEVLRAAKPELFGNLAHPGVQPGGKPVKAPFDNIGWVESGDGSRFVSAAHTTAEQKDLKGKWLHDPATVKPKRPGGKPTQPAGDLVKAIAEVTKLRQQKSGLAVTLALTTNSEPPLEVLVAANTLASSASIDLHIWSASRISQFLDTSPIGQVIRRNHFGVDVVMISKELLLEMCARTVLDYLPGAVSGEHIDREGFALGMADTLVVGPSGMGKTTACAGAISARLKRGVPALVLRNELVAGSPTMDDAIESELRRQLPELESRVGSKALELCSVDEPMLILVEDLNRADNPGLLLNKLLTWSRSQKETQAPERRWRLVCPVWPRQLESIENQSRTLVDVTVVTLGPFSEKEGTQAVLRRANAVGVEIDQERAAAVAQKLGYDPLLIGLHDVRDILSAANVIREYVGDRLGVVSHLVDCSKFDLRSAVDQVLLGMLEHRTLSPSWNDVKTWIGDGEAIALLKQLARDGSVLRISETERGSAGQIHFRHDRVLYSMLSDTVGERLDTDLQPSYVRDPFFAEIVGAAAVRVELSLEHLCALTEESPAAVAHALKIASEHGSDYARTAFSALSQWLPHGESREVRTFANMRYAVATVLAATDNPDVLALVDQFPSDDSPWQPLFAAGFRNADLAAGLNYFSISGLGTSVIGMRALTSHVKRRFGQSLVHAVDTVLRRIDMTHMQGRSHRMSALLLAGYIGDPALADAIRTCWEQEIWPDEHAGEDHLRVYLFATSRCCDRGAQDLIRYVCDVWAGLPDDPDSAIGQPVNRLAADNVSWAYRDYAPHPDAVAYFVERADLDERLAWPITYMLRTVDHPLAVEQLARYAAKSGYSSALGLRSDWERHARKADRTMSAESKNRLYELACDQSEPDEVRREAFALWAVALAELDVEGARRISETSPVYTQALWARARRRDLSVVPEIAKRLNENPEFWLHLARYVWSDELTAMLPPLLQRIADSPVDSQPAFEDAVGGVLKRIDSEQAISMLVPLWEKLRGKSSLVQVALISTTSESAALVAEAIAASTKPEELIDRCVLQCSMVFEGEVGISSVSQMKNLLPYLHLISESALTRLWDICTTRGWIEFRDRHLVQPIRHLPSRRVYLPGDAVDTSDLDGSLGQLWPRPEYWFERYLRQGVPRDKLIETAVDWAKNQPHPQAMRVCAGLFGALATRSEFGRFEFAFHGRSDAAELMPALRFDVFARTLS